MVARMDEFVASSKKTDSAGVGVSENGDCYTIKNCYFCYRNHTLLNAFNNNSGVPESCFSCCWQYLKLKDRQKDFVLTPKIRETIRIKSEEEREKFEIDFLA
jgi:hypothetical protein